ncbi:hypothetical protein [Streptomyces sp. NBC_00316]|uniref:hypothetical protein n=1 Tax=Streptomyces sp. NBC_00316 TaxID=2975710 RepID=UPI002E2E0715|nr:hypothetical protein [Streptomyces sp. NBC_00316]
MVLRDGGEHRGTRAAQKRRHTGGASLTGRGSRGGELTGALVLAGGIAHGNGPAVGDDGACAEHRRNEQEAFPFQVEVTIGSVHHPDFQNRRVPPHPLGVGLGQQLLDTAGEQLLQTQGSIDRQVFRELVPVRTEQACVEMAESCAELSEQRCIVCQVASPLGEGGMMMRRFQQTRPHPLARCAAYLFQKVFDSAHFGGAEEAWRISHSRHEGQDHARLGRQLRASMVPPGVESGGLAAALQGSRCKFQLVQRHRRLSHTSPGQILNREVYAIDHDSLRRSFRNVVLRSRPNHIEFVAFAGDAEPAVSRSRRRTGT